MRFSLRRLMLLFPAWVIAYFLAPHTTIQEVRYSWRHDAAATAIRFIRIHAENETYDEPGLPLEQIDFKHFWQEMGGNRDPWDNPYQIVEHEKPNNEYPHNIHAFSFGEDGISRSFGNDADDINSWNYCRTKYYGPQIQAYFRRQALWRTLWLTPLVFLAMLFVGRLFRPAIAR